uniref:Uncharacterized protein n=1 Tax=Anguilla anguilla TaxID=7936 RepID=A0A0E9TPJ9_ANGAN
MSREFFSQYSLKCKSQWVNILSFPFQVCHIDGLTIYFFSNTDI